jgi:GNAT superfamily N-acetyltransferase
MITIIENDLPLTEKTVLLVPELTLSKSIAAFLADKEHLALVALYHQTPAGFKIAYTQSDICLYSWLGGVHPQYRKLGIASALLDYQENWARQHGFQKITVKSMNKYPDMLRFLIKNGYAITGTEQQSHSKEIKIRFEKFI